MTHSSHYAIRIAAPAATGPQSRVRKQFNTLVQKLEAERVKLALWRSELPKIRALADSEYRPLAQRFDVHRKQMLLALDRAYYDRTMGKKDKQKLVELICSTALDLLGCDEGDDDVKAIYNTHSGGDFDLEMDQEHAMMRKLVADMTGVELDEDADIGSPAALFEAMQKKMDARAEEDAERAGQACPGAAAKPAKPVKLSAREARHQAEAAKLKQSVRDIFRKLASALHPDRETDPAEHGRKTALMQRANVAYAANDLLGLLELQLEVDQIDQTGLDNLDDDRIKQYNRILGDQVREIGLEIHVLESAVTLDMGWELGRRCTPTAMMRGLRADIKEMRANVKNIEADLEVFGDVKQIKRWLKGFDIVEDAPSHGEPWF